MHVAYISSEHMSPSLLQYPPALLSGNKTLKALGKIVAEGIFVFPGCGPNFEPTHEKRILITLAISTASAEPAHKRSLAEAFSVRGHVVEILWKLMINA